MDPAGRAAFSADRNSIRVLMACFESALRRDAASSFSSSSSSSSPPNLASSRPMPTASSHVRYLAGGCVCVPECLSCGPGPTGHTLSLSLSHTHTRTLAHNTGALRYVAGDGDAASEVLAQDAQLFGRLEDLLTRCGASDDATVARHCAVRGRDGWSVYLCACYITIRWLSEVANC